MSIGGTLQYLELARPSVDRDGDQGGGMGPTEGDFLFSARAGVLFAWDIECVWFGESD